ncbi:DUF7678 domain-containing protein [Desulforamulus aeronauticus]|uniref:DUF7678 domain-containing protein n=1 Tax=Desulforamulus aeronauticus DSM 10349 TaxID=1121421 RepID=A0A1M6WE17_9FIRM|nr:hypothetical protein [Desulforamulus aeronauticus]SHK92020.1 hypothetical protein SAMN02745123_03585 [Desulforamulus aeronauticus DSM 10349]
MQNILKNLFLGRFKPSGWVHGQLKGYDFEAKVYDHPSTNGIDGGRISKLTIKRGGEIIAHYDRGWDVKPESKGRREVLERIKSLIG